MKNTILTLIFIVSLNTIVTSCKKKENDLSDIEMRDENKTIAFDSTKMADFFNKFPKFKEFQPDINELYKKYNHHFIWYDKDGMVEFAEALFNRTNQIGADGVVAKLPYKSEINNLFFDNRGEKPELTSELLISSMYFFYAKNVLQGVETSQSKQTGWYLPREKLNYVAYLDTLMKDPNRLNQDKTELLPMYYNLKKGLNKYQKIKKQGGWGTIILPEGIKTLKIGDSSSVIAQVRKRLFLSGDLKNNSNKNVFDKELQSAIVNYEIRNNQNADSIITKSLIEDLNVSVDDRIKTIVVNMERCRWIPVENFKKNEFIAVNIPSYRVRYIKDSKVRLESNVVVGKEMNKTVVFSGEMSYLVFSPYWNIPRSIVEKEIKPGIAKNSNYLAEHNMEYNGNNIRQKPGPRNSLGLVKFMFPNSNNIYLHDTPAKSLFNKEERALSHGCVRVEKAKELAIAILEDDKNWNENKIDQAMKSGTEKHYTLKRKIPVYIAYFTAAADENGNVSFFKDVYKRDDRLYGLIYK
ncbi:L,D-transpeptidase family protein [Flavobacterium sp. NST-5]|uniref:L,D-transpeptidase family protein n=1 Tax=Flavobacterium ichthyis TaxID=2698827 RepID=A0ABW9Z7T9_9FLAO|nr:L,D-transpeptidase family protein [Flavobacterium ichthyis]NBL64930.1 L,D-transpeptidase family protein [Flavobacterium ichthyis]